jgi:hypothetical protein
MADQRRKCGVGAYRPRYVLDLLLAPIVQRQLVQRQPALALEMVVGGSGNQYTAGFTELLKTSGGHYHIYQVKVLSPENPDRLRH